MSKRKLAYQFAGGVIGLIGLNLVGASSAEASGMSPASNPGGACMSGCVPFSNPGGGGKEPPYSNPGGCGSSIGCLPSSNPGGSGNNPPYSNPGGACTTGGCPPFSNAGGGGKEPPFSNPGGGGKEPPYSNPGGGNCKTGKCDGPVIPGKDPGTFGKDPKDNIYGEQEAKERAGYVTAIGNSKAPGFNGGVGNSIGNYAASGSGLSKQFMQLLSAASADLSDKSARVAAIQSRSTPAARKDTPVRFSRVADANADCGCNDTAAAAPDTSAELAAAKAAEAEAAASLAKAQQQAREFLEQQKKAGNNLAVGTQFSPIW